MCIRDSCITVSSDDDKPAATYTALMPDRSKAEHLYKMLKKLNPNIDGEMARRSFGAEAYPAANMFTDEVMDYFIAHTSHVGEEQFMREMRVNHKSAFAQLWDGSDLTKDEKTTSLMAMARANDTYPGLGQALRIWKNYRGGDPVLAGFADMAV